MARVIFFPFYFSFFSSIYFFDFLIIISERASGTWYVSWVKGRKEGRDVVRDKQPLMLLHVCVRDKAHLHCNSIIEVLSSYIGTP